MQLFLPFALVAIVAAGTSSFSSFTTLFFVDLGYSFAFIGLMVSTFNIAVAVAELPFAVVFDRYSSKLSVLIGFLIRMIAFALFASALSPNLMLAAQTLAGIATAATSGTLVALVINDIQSRTYENVREANSRLNLISGMGSLTGGTCGAIGFYFYPPSIWLLAIAFFGIGALLIFLVYDKEAQGGDETLGEMARNVARISRFRATYLLVLANAAAVAPVILWPAKFGAGSLGFVVTGFYIVTIASLLAGRLVKWLDLKPAHIRWNALVNAASVLAFALIDNFYFALGAFLLMTLSHISLTIQIGSIFHTFVENNVRASSGSVVSLADSLIVAAFAPIIGILADTFSIAAGISLSVLLYIAIFIASSAGARAYAHSSA